MSNIVAILLAIWIGSVGNFVGKAPDALQFFRTIFSVFGEIEIAFGHPYVDNKASNKCTFGEIGIICYADNCRQTTQPPWPFSWRGFVDKSRCIHNLLLIREQEIAFGAFVGSHIFAKEPLSRLDFFSIIQLVGAEQEMTGGTHPLCWRLTNISNGHAYRNARMMLRHDYHIRVYDFCLDPRPSLSNESFKCNVNRPARLDQLASDQPDALFLTCCEENPRGQSHVGLPTGPKR